MGLNPNHSVELTKIREQLAQAIALLNASDRPLSGVRDTQRRVAEAHLRKAIEEIDVALLDRS